MNTLNHLLCVYLQDICPICVAYITAVCIEQVHTGLEPRFTHHQDLQSIRCTLYFGEFQGLIIEIHGSDGAFFTQDTCFTQRKSCKTRIEVGKITKLPTRSGLKISVFAATCGSTQNTKPLERQPQPSFVSVFGFVILVVSARARIQILV